MSLLIAAYDAPSSVKQRADFVCDGIDDHVEIQAALDVSSVLLSEGNFVLKGVRIPTRRTLEGVGRSTHLTLASGITQAEADAYAGCLLRTYPFDVQSEDITIRNLVLDGNKEAQTIDQSPGVWTMLGLYLKNCRRVVVENVHAQKCLSGGIYVEGWTPTQSYPEYLALRDLWLTDNGKVIAKPAGGTWPVRGGLHMEIARHIIVDGVFAIDNLGDGISLTGYSQGGVEMPLSDVLLANCQSRGNGAGGETYAGYRVGDYSQSVSLRNCLSRDDHGYGMVIYSSYPAQLLRNIAASGCRIDGTTGDATHGYGLYAANVKGLRLMDLDVANAASAGVRLVGCQDIDLAHIGQEGCQAPLWLYGCIHAAVTHCYSRNTAQQRGLSVEACHHVRIIGGLYTNNQTYGLSVTAPVGGTGSHVQVIGVRAYGQTYGLALYETDAGSLTDVLVVANDLRGNTQAGRYQSMAVAPLLSANLE